MPKPKPAKYFTLKTDSETRLWMLFDKPPASGKATHTYWSIDWQHCSSRTKKRQIGIDRFINMINKNAHNLPKARIYDATTDELLMTFEYGKQTYP